MTERPKVELIDMYRRWCEREDDSGLSLDAVRSLLAEVDALTKALAESEAHGFELVAAETRMTERMRGERDTAIARAEAAERERDEQRDALSRLRRIVELARVYRASVESEGAISDDLEDDARDALFDALDGCPPRQSDTDLAEAHRRELMARGVEEAAELAKRAVHCPQCGPSTEEPRGYPTNCKANPARGHVAREAGRTHVAALLTKRATDLRGGK